jgi:hypothetical protein
MVMGNQQRIDVVDIATISGQSRLRLLSAHACVEKQTLISGFDVDAVSITARLQRNDFHGDIIQVAQSLQQGGKADLKRISPSGTVFPIADHWSLPTAH